MIWRPDFCSGCAIEVNTDWTAGTVIQKCKDHESVLDAKLFTTLLSESREKEYARKIIADHTGIEAYNLSYRFDAQRKIFIKVPGLRTQDRSALEPQIATVSNRVTLE